MRLPRFTRPTSTPLIRTLVGLITGIPSGPQESSRRSGSIISTWAPRTGSDVVGMVTILDLLPEAGVLLDGMQGLVLDRPPGLCRLLLRLLPVVPGAQAEQGLLTVVIPAHPVIDLIRRLAAHPAP